MKGWVLLALLVLLMAVPVNAADPDRIIVNSQDWRDVYSTMLYGTLTEKNVLFLVSDRHSALLLNAVPKPSHLWIINSQRTPFVRGFGEIAQSEGHTIEDFSYANANMEFARQVDTTKFILIDDAYGYNAVSVAPYAAVSRSYVLFANRDNIDTVTDLLTERGATDVIVYGHVDREVLNAVAQFNPEIINRDGDRFANNIEIVKKYQAISSAKQVILTNGEFIETGIMSGKEPVIFIGSNNVPDVVREYIQSSDIKVGVLIGNELVNTATFIRRQVGISVFVKFARSARVPSAAISQVEALDMFYLPRYSLDLALESITYNRATKELEVTLSNRAGQAVYAKGSYTVTDGNAKQTVGDTNAVFIESNELKTFIYPVDEIDSQRATVDAFVIYGESRNSLEKLIEATYCLTCENKLGTVDIIDSCDMNLSAVTYDKGKSLFRVEVLNPSQAACYLDVQLSDVVIAAERVTLALESVAALAPGDQRSLRIKAQLDEEDIADNQFVNVKAFYGQRENSLVKVKEERLPLLLSAAVFAGVGGIVSLALMGALCIAIGVIVWKLYAGRRRRV